MGNLPACDFNDSLLVSFANPLIYVIEPLIAGKTTGAFAKGKRDSAYQDYFASSSGILTLITLIVMIIAPQVGAFETDLTVNGLKQAQTNLTRTKTMADQTEASRYNIQMVYLS